MGISIRLRKMQCTGNDEEKRPFFEVNYQTIEGRCSLEDLQAFVSDGKRAETPSRADQCRQLPPGRTQAPTRHDAPSENLYTRRARRGKEGHYIPLIDTYI
jgi:hypothetical protein